LKYECCRADEGHYATSLILDPRRNLLTWTALAGQDSLMVQTPYGEDPAAQSETLRELLQRACGERLPEGHFYALNNRVSVRYVNAEEKARTQGCPANGEACTYTVFPCVLDALSDVCTVYIAGGRGSMSSPRYDAPMNIVAEVVPVKAYSGYLFFRREAPAEFFRISFPDACPENYRDGDLEYSVNGHWKIPVTRRMMERGEFYVRTERKPVLTARNAGVRLSEPRRDA